MRSGPYNVASKAVGAKTTDPPLGSNVAPPSVAKGSAIDEPPSASSTTGAISTPTTSSSLLSSSTVPASSQVSKAASKLPAGPSTVVATERSRSGSRSQSGSNRITRPTYIIRPTIVGLPSARPHAPKIPTHTFLSTSISLLLYLAVMVIIFSVDCPFDREVGQFFAFVLLAFSGSLFILIINLTAVKYHRYNCVSTSLSLLYSGSAALVVFGLVDTSIRGLCKPGNLASDSIFKSGIPSNFFMWIMTSLSVLWQLIAYYYYG